MYNPTKVADFPIVLKHEFPNEQENYIDEKIDEGQYKKRFRYDRDVRGVGTAAPK